MRDYTTDFLSNNFQLDFEERSQISQRLENMMKNLEKKLKKQISKEKENLQRWFK